MNTTQPVYLVLNTPAGADVALANRFLTLGQGANAAPAINVQKISSLVKQAGVAAVGKSQTLTVTTATAGQNYGVQFTQKQQGGQFQSHYISYEAVTGDSTTTIAAALSAVATELLNSGTIELTSATNSTNTLPFVGIATNPLFQITILEGPMTLAAASPAGNEALGQGADLLASGIVAINEVPVSGTSYDKLTIEYGTKVESGSTITRDQDSTLVVYYNNAAGAGLTAFKADLNTALTNGATANPEMITVADAIS
jgi:hypothetical protein